MADTLPPFPFGNEKSSPELMNAVTVEDDDLLIPEPEEDLYNFQDEILSDDNIEELSEFLKKNERIVDILEKGNDLKEYIDEVEEDLFQNEEKSAIEYSNQINNMIALHEEINSCDHILSSMSNYLTVFQQNIGKLSDEIQSIQDKSKDIQNRMNNRQKLASPLRRFIESTILSPELIKAICNEEVNEKYISYIMMLEQHMDTTKKMEEGDFVSSVSTKTVKTEVEKLKFKAITRIREFLIYRIYSLRKPKTNIQILQQSVLLKYSYFTNFLYEHCPEVAEEIKNIYCATVGKLFYAHFKVYVSILSKLHLEIGTKSDLIGAMDQPAIKGIKKTGAFSLGTGESDRSIVMNNLEVDAIVPYVTQKKYTFECTFRSIFYLLVDTFSTEYVFAKKFFPRVNPETIVNSIFEKIFKLLKEYLTQIVSKSFDLIGLIFHVAIIQYFQNKVQKRQINCLNSYCELLLDLIQGRITILFNAQIESVNKLLLAPLPVGVVDTRPHFVVRKFAELMASILSISIPDYNRTVIKENLRILSASIEGLLMYYSNDMEYLDRTVFLLNNYDVVLSVLGERRVSQSQELAHWKALNSSEVTNYIETILLLHCSPLIPFVKTLNSGKIPSEKEVGKVLYEFSNNWKTSISKINQSGMKYFSNFKNGFEILKQTLTQFTMYYSRFEEFVKSQFKTANFRKDLISVSTVRYEIQTYLEKSF